MPSVTERISRLLGQRNEEQVDMQHAEQIAENEEKKRLDEQQVETRELLERVGVVESLSEVNKVYLKGRGKIKKLSGIFGYEIDHYISGGGDNAGYDHSTTHSFGASLVQLRWKKNNKQHYQILVGARSGHLAVKASEIQTGNDNVNHNRGTDIIEPTKHGDSIIGTNSLDDDELKNRVDEKIAQAFSDLLSPPHRVR